MSSLIPPDLVTWVLGRDLMASDAEFVEKAIEVSFKVFFKLFLSSHYNFLLNRLASAQF
jgi:hypothetical protein